MGKITLLVRTCLIIFLFFCSNTYLLAYGNADLEKFTSTSESICYMFFESKELKPLDFKNSVIETFTASPYKEIEVATSKMYATPTINIGSNTNLSVCTGITSVNLPYTNATNSANRYYINYDATANNQGFTDVDNKTFAGGVSGNFPLIIPQAAAPGTYTAILNVHNNTNEKSVDYNFKITIKANPTIDNPSNKTQDVCVNTAISTISFTIGSNGTGATVSSGLPTGVTGSYGNGIFKISGTPNTSGTYNYTVTTTGDCTQQSRSGVITVKSNPTFTKPADITACHNSQINAINFSGSTVSNTNYSWTNDNINIGLATSGNGNILAFTAKNTTNAPITGNITVSPTANGCVGTPQTFKVTVNPQATFTKPADIVACNNEAISEINFTGASVAGTTYTWTNDDLSIGLATSGNGTISAFTAKNTTNAPITGNITVTPTANGCVGTPQTFKVTVNPQATFTKPADIVACNNEAISAINFSGASVDGTTYTWINDNASIGLATSGNGNISAFTARNTTSDPINGNITVTPSANNCVGTPQTFKITVNPTTTFTKPTDITACNGGIISKISFSGSNVANTTYSWVNSNSDIGLAASGDGDIAQFTALNNTGNPITSTITVTPSANNCDGTSQTFEITVNPSINIEYNITPVACNGENNGSFTITNTTGGNGNYRYSITNSAFNTTKTFTGLTTGDYTIYVQDTEGCTYQEIITIGEPDNLEMTTTPTSTPASCFGGNDGTITAGTIIGGNGSYLYSIDNTTYTSSNSFTGVSAGTYTIFVKDSKDCALQIIVNVSEAEKLSATITKTNVSCFDETDDIDDSDGTITLTNPTGGSGDYEFSINNGAWQNNSTFTGLNPGNYIIAIRDAGISNCEVILDSAYEITQPNTPITSQISATRTTTYGTPTGTATVTPTGGTPGYTYEWRKSGGTEIIQTTKTATNLNAGDYEVSIIDINGCKIVKNITVIDALEAFIVPISICEGDEESIRVSYFGVEDDTAHGGKPGYTYAWTFGAGASISSATGIGPHRITYTNTGNKNITLIVTDSSGNTFSTLEQQYVGNCYEPCGKSENIEFNPDNIYIGTIDGTPIDTNIFGNCDNSTPKYIFLQVDKASNIYHPYTELSYTVSNGILEESENYFTNACRDNSEIDDDPNDSKDGKVGEFIRLTRDPILWECGDNLDIDSFYITWTTNPDKSCGQSNNAFCYSTNEPVILPTLLDANAVATPINCKGDETGIITVTASGGFAPYSYSLTSTSGPFQNSNKFTNLLAGTYNVYVKGARGQTRTKTVTVTEPSSSVSVSVSKTNPVCFGGFGEAKVEGSGGTPYQPGVLTNDAEYEYLWNDSLGQTTATAIDLVAGQYTVTIIDANGCQALETVTIIDPPQLTVATTGENQAFNCGFTTTKLEGNEFDNTKEIGSWSILSGTGGTIAEPNNPISTFTGTAGTYELQWNITDLNGNCGTTSTMTINFIEDCNRIDFDGQDDHVLLGDNYSLTTGPFSLEVWIKMESTTGVKTILSKRNTKDLGTGGYDLIVNNGAPTFRWGNNSVTTSSKLTTNRWYHLAVIFDGSKVYLYVDGIDIGNKSLTNPVAIASPFIIGAMYHNDTPDSPVNYFHGWIEELRIWNIALETEQLHFMMNQRLELNSTPVKGTVLPVNVPSALSWNNLSGYFQLIPSTITNGTIPDLSSAAISGELKNIDTNQENSAPLPYTSISNGVWSDRNTWARPDVWDYPNALGINGEKIDWNIAEISHDISSGGQDISLLGLFSLSNELKIYNPNENQDETNSGQGLFISHYLKLDGKIKLYGDSQLIQTEGSILDNNSSGFIEKDQQGTASSYNYNYWSSPVVPQGNAINSTYSVAGVMMDGTDSKAPIILNFGQGVTFADGAKSTPGNSQKISNYWIYKFRGKADEYSDFEHIGSTGVLNVGEGYTMKGTSGNAAIADRQNYIFKGKPNNGDISLNVGKDQNYLLGNPYPSAIDANKFILDNLNASGGTNTNNIFNGALYFWDHFGGKTHTLREYVGGYATYNLVGGVKAIATDDRINNNNESSSDEHEPGQYIPVGQGFFINTVLDEALSGSITVDGGDVIFKNSQRAFIREQNYISRFLSQEKNTASQKEAKSEAKIRLDFSSPMGYNRQILVGLSEYATNGFDLGYDAPLNDYNLEDFFWLIDNREFVIQGVSNFDEDQVLPVGIYISKKGDFSIKINALENVSEITNIYLRDIEENKYFDLRESEFKMEIEPGAYYERFEIVFSKPEETTPDSEEEEESSTEDTEETNTEGSEETTEETEEEIEEIIIPENISISDIDIFYMSNNKELAISNPYLLPIQKVEIYNLLGQKIQQYMEVSTQKEIRLPVVEFATGIYIVKLYTGDSQISKNIILK